jgi:hypothetical protein
MLQQDRPSSEIRVLIRRNSSPPAEGSGQKAGTLQEPMVDGDLDFCDLNREQLRIHLLGCEHALGVHRFSMPCPPECPLEEITHDEARNRAALLLRGKIPSGT